MRDTWIHFVRLTSFLNQFQFRIIMKTLTRITTLLVIAIFLFSTGGLTGQADTSPEKAVRTATISKDFIIQLPENQEDLADVYVIDIHALSFPSKEKLERFCQSFSFDFQTITGDFTKQQMKLELDLSVLRAKGITKQQVANYLKLGARRMALFFNKSDN